MKARTWILFVSVLCLMAVAASAEWERTVSAWDTRVPAQGKLQLSAWGGYYAWESGGADGNELGANVYAHYGLADNWSVCLAPGFMRWDVDGGGSESGLADTDVMTTYRFMDEAAAGFDIGVMAGVSLPTGDEDKGLGSGSVEPTVGLLAAKTFGAVVAVANIGGRLILDADDGEEDFTLGLSLEGIYSVSDQLSVNAAFSAATARWEDGDENADIGLGARFHPMEQAFLGGMAYLSLTDSYDWGVTIGGGYEF